VQTVEVVEGKDGEMKSTKEAESTPVKEKAVQAAEPKAG